MNLRADTLRSLRRRCAMTHTEWGGWRVQVQRSLIWTCEEHSTCVHGIDVEQVSESNNGWQEVPEVEGGPKRKEKSGEGEQCVHSYSEHVAPLEAPRGAGAEGLKDSEEHGRKGEVGENTAHRGSFPAKNEVIRIGSG